MFEAKSCMWEKRSVSLTDPEPGAIIKEKKSRFHWDYTSHQMRHLVYNINLKPMYIWVLPQNMHQSTHNRPNHKMHSKDWGAKPFQCLLCSGKWVLIWVFGCSKDTRLTGLWLFPLEVYRLPITCIQMIQQGNVIWDCHRCKTVFSFEVLSPSKTLQGD